MPPLTSPSGCDCCRHLTQTIAELEGHISNLYRLRNELFLESLVAEVATPTTSAEGELDYTLLAQLTSRLSWLPNPTLRTPGYSRELNQRHWLRLLSHQI